MGVDLHNTYNMILIKMMIMTMMMIMMMKMKKMIIALREALKKTAKGHDQPSECNRDTSKNQFSVILFQSDIHYAYRNCLH